MILDLLKTILVKGNSSNTSRADLKTSASGYKPRRTGWQVRKYRCKRSTGRGARQGSPNAARAAKEKMTSFEEEGFDGVLFLRSNAQPTPGLSGQDR